MNEISLRVWTPDEGYRRLPYIVSDEDIVGHDVAEGRLPQEMYFPALVGRKNQAIERMSREQQKLRDEIILLRQHHLGQKECFRAYLIPSSLKHDGVSGHAPPKGAVLVEEFDGPMPYPVDEARFAQYREAARDYVVGRARDGAYYNSEFEGGEILIWSNSYSEARFSIPTEDVSHGGSGTPYGNATE